MSSPTFPHPHVPKDDLLAWWPDLLRELVRGADERKHGFHTLALATRGLDDRPEVRTVVLRRTATLPLRIQVHTDRRAPKVAEIRRDPRVTFLAYDFGLELQMRISGQAEILTAGPDFERAWEGTKHFARRCYLAPLAPGTRTETSDPNLPPGLLTREPTEAESAPGREWFSVIRTVIEHIDVLSLAVHGHRRARFDFDPATSGEQPRQATWVAV